MSMNAEMQSIAEERANASFPVRELTYFFYGKEHTRNLETASEIISRDPLLFSKNDHPFDTPRPVARARTMARIKRGREVRDTLEPGVEAAFRELMNKHDKSYSMRVYVHENLFRESIWHQGTKEQFDKWEDDIRHMRVIGCFSMTELGHSSFLRGLETTATYDRATQQFVINTPTLTATKWWIGMAGQTATHTVALCQLVIDGRECGLNWFIVPLRNGDTGQLLPGVLCGDCGAKMGRNGLDNGFLQFTSVRIPRENMLMKWSQVSPEGYYTAPANPAVSYAALIGERFWAIIEVTDSTAQALTIATRYGAVRRQGTKDQRLLDYQMHSYQLMPAIAGVYVIQAVRNRLLQQWGETLKLQDNPATLKLFLSHLNEMHSLAAGMKAWCGWWAVDVLEKSRRCLGGYAYSAYNNIHQITSDFAVVTTGGGDNSVLAQQSARFLVSSLQRAEAGKKLPGLVSFLADAKAIRVQKGNASTPSDLHLTSFYVDAYRWLAVTLISKAASLLQSDVMKGMMPEDAWNNNMVTLIEAAKAHCVFYLVETFAKIVEASRSEHPDVHGVLQRLATMFALFHMKHEFMRFFVEHGYLHSQQAAMVDAEVLRLCGELRKDAVPLVDAFNYPDWVLKSPLGRYDGDVYNRFFETVTNAPNAIGRPDYWAESVAPLTARRSKL